MTCDSQSKVQAQHLKRNAYLYVRQSTLRQVFENTESTKRQYDLRQRAIALGWPVDQVIVIDSARDNPANSQQIVKASSGWSPRWAWGVPGS
jgi:hypothetical protein